MLWKYIKTKHSFLKTATSAGTLTLVAGSPQYHIFTGSTTHNLKLPNATTTSNGSGIAFTVINSSTGIITVLLNDNSTLTTIAANTSKDFVLTDHSTSNGTWRVVSFSGASGGGIGGIAPGSVVTGNTTLTAGDKGRVVNVDTTSGAVNITLPAPAANLVYTIKDYGGYSSTNNINVLRNSSEKIDNIQADYVINIRYDTVTFISNGTDWFVMGSYGLETPPSTLGVWAGGSGVYNIIEYVQIPTLASLTTYFGDLSVLKARGAGMASTTRGLFAGGETSTPAFIASIDYITFATASNAQNFGNLTTNRTGTAGCGSTTRGLAAGGESGPSNVIDYVTFASAGNAIDFGDLTQARQYLASMSSPVRGVWGGGQTGVDVNTIDYVTIATLGNAIDFGDLTQARRHLGGSGSNTRGIFNTGNTGIVVNTIDYITLATLANANDFGDATAAKDGAYGCSSNVRSVWGGGFPGGATTVIDYVTIATISNASDFGDLLAARGNTTSCSNGHGGL